MIDLALYTLSGFSGFMVGVCLLRTRPSYWAFRRWLERTKDCVVLTKEQSDDYRAWVELERPISGSGGHPAIYRAIVKDRDAMKAENRELASELRREQNRRRPDMPW